jgi:hypothetical protein
MPDGRDVAVARLVMVAGMAAMFLPLPPAVLWALVGVFALDACWLAGRLVAGVRPGGGATRMHRLHHLICHLAMIYLIVLMVFRMPAMAGMPAMAPAGSGTLPMLLLAVDLGVVIYFVALAVWSALRLVPALAPAGTRAATAYQVVVSGAMLYMLFATVA